MKRKLIAMLSCVALAAASIAGCSSSKPAESAAAPAETTRLRKVPRPRHRQETSKSH